MMQCAISICRTGTMEMIEDANPYWVTNRMLKTTKRNRYLTDLGVKYHLTNWFALEGKTSLG